MKIFKRVLFVIVLFPFSPKIHAQDTDLTNRVLVIQNGNSPVSKSIAKFYMTRRGVSNILTIKCKDDAKDQTAESIDFTNYVSKIQQPINEFLQSHPDIDFIVLTKGIPIRIINSPDKPNGGVCSLDSRLSALGYSEKKTSSIVNISDPGYGSAYKGTAWANKFWNSNNRFTHKAFGGYLVTRLDGYTEADAKALVTRSLQAERNLKTHKGGDGPILLDACPDYGSANEADAPYSIIPANYTQGQTINIIKESAYGQYNTDMTVASKYLSTKKITYKYDNTNAFVEKNITVMGYSSWGSNDTHYDASVYNSLKFNAGAICETAVSTSGRTFRPTTGGQSLIADLIKQGATGAKGYTDEPLLQGISSPSILFNRYTRGWTLAESYYAASRVVGWMGVVLGDPICRAYADSTLITSNSIVSNPFNSASPDSTGALNNRPANKVIFYPNPSSDIVHVNIDGDYNYKIFELGGRTVKENKLINKQISVSDLHKGIYIIYLYNGSTVITGKVIRRE